MLMLVGSIASMASTVSAFGSSPNPQIEARQHSKGLKTLLLNLITGSCCRHDWGFTQKPLSSTEQTQNQLF